MNRQLLPAILLIIGLLTFPLEINLSSNVVTHNIAYTHIITSVERGITKSREISNIQAIVFVTPDCSYKALEYLVNIANESIHIMIYEMWSVDVASLLANASKRGVDVKIIFEGETYGSSGINYNRNMSAMLYNFSGHLIDSEDIHFENVSIGYFHSKVIIVDSKVALITSENIFPTSFPPDPTSIDLRPYSTASRGWGIILFNETIAQELDNIFWEVFENYSIPYSPSDYWEAPRSWGTLEYTPQFDWQSITDISSLQLVTTLGYKNVTNSYEEISKLIVGSEEYILMEQMYIYNSTEVIQDLIHNLTDAHSRGVTIQIIMEDNFQSDYENVSKYLESLGMHTAPAFNDSCIYLFLHNKGMIVDNDHVLIGSINWSGSAMLRNTEIGIIVVSKQANKYYTKVFGFDWEKSKGDTFDRDNDGLSDIYENEHSLNAESPDTDGDYLSDYDEIFAYNTDPTSPDTIFAHIISPMNGEYLSRTTFWLNWSITNMQYVDSIEIYVNDSMHATVANTSVLLNLTDESYNIIRVSPRAIIPVKTVEAKIGVYIDTKPPNIEVLMHANTTTNDSSIRLLARISDFSLSAIEVLHNGTSILKKTVNQKEVLVNMTIILYKGTNEIKIVANDHAGNNQTRTIYINYRPEESQTNESQETSNNNSIPTLPQNESAQNELYILIFHRFLGTMILLVLVLSAIMLIKKRRYISGE